MKEQRLRSMVDPTGGDAPVQRFHEVLVESIRDEKPTYLTGTFTVAEIYQSLVPYRTHRNRLGLEMNGDYEDTLLRLLAGEGDFLLLQSEPVRDRIRKELDSRNPNTGIYREFAAAEVRLNPERLPNGLDVAPEGEPAEQAAPESVESAAIEGNGRAAVREREPRGRAGPSASTACPECGEALPQRDNLQFCPFCGANTRVTPCRQCGEILERAWRFCVACGAPAKD